MSEEYEVKFRNLRIVGAAMREAQKNYFMMKMPSELRKAKELEVRFDKLLAEK